MCRGLGKKRLCYMPGQQHQLCLHNFLKNMCLLISQRERKGVERNFNDKRTFHRLPPSHPLHGGLSPNPCMCPAWEANCDLLRHNGCALSVS